MFERYTENARRVIFFARYEASAFGSPYIETEHIMLGMLRENKPMLTKAFGSVAALEKLENELRGIPSQGERTPVSVDLPLSNPAKRVLAFSAEEAERLNDQHIGPQHLFLGLVREKEGAVAQLLAGLNLNLAELRVEFEPMRDPELERIRRVTAQDRADRGEAVLEFVHDQRGRTVATARLAAVYAIPRKGEEVVLQDNNGEWLQFRVADVRQVFKKRPEGVLNATQVLSKVIVYVSPVEKKPVIPDAT